MIKPELLAIGIYVAILFGIGFASYRKQQTATDFIIGGRSLNYWLTAIAAHASDMSSWLFMGFPAVIFTGGLFNSWFAVGLCLFMFLNWLFVAPRVRVKTEEYNSLTFSSFFESRFHDTSGMIRIFTAIISLIFYTIYISAGIVGLGILVDSLFGIDYHLAISVGIVVVVPYLFIGGYTTLAWIDLFQGFFLLLAIVAVPVIAMPKVGGFAGIQEALTTHGLSFSMIPNTSPKTLWKIFFSICGWGIGYFGQPHIVTKFMGIRKVSHIKKSMAVGMSWQVIALSSATLIGLIGIAYFPGGLANTELVFVKMVKDIFPPFIIALILCGILGATISTMDSQILVLASSLSEDFYKKIFHKDASPKHLLWVSRFFVLLVTAFAFSIAFFKISTIYSLVFFAWSGLGSAFGPLLLFSLYSKKANKYGAWGGIIVGGAVSLIWPLYSKQFPIDIPTLVPGFLLSSFAIFVLSHITRRHHEKTQHHSH
ncbi:sodium:solute symporter family transporter [Candidatus Neptunochlamydia vexilliferae]|uniref:Sodium/proline symporter n=1 Tax=Candidatus Neptunichlamydia vexilliferae TaxID=1651774 RepID=A0ABS0AZL7_9BACT|nr:sodium/proline symporter [Candidatus Neptunochlamydia vexilliferae]MBF5059578.1 putative symporter YcgO [Candidatus Neptunochlamydia vexilliferae]